MKLVQEYYEKMGITIFLNCTKDIEVSGYPNEFSQVMMNLFSNAKDALMKIKYLRNILKWLSKKRILMQ